jgi:hypothetical protein
LAYRFAYYRLPQIRALHEGTQSGIVACNAKISAFPPEIARIDARLETFPPMFGKLQAQVRSRCCTPLGCHCSAGRRSLPH